jgi:hypothetical protein
MTADRRRDDVGRVLRSIERRVLEEVRIGTVDRVVIAAIVVVLATAAYLGFRFSAQSARDGLNGDWLSVIATGVFTLACIGSLGAVVVQRFRSCCLALYLSGLATVTGMSALWSQQTGTAGLSLWAPLGFGAAAVLGIAWTRVLATPLRRSQPDMWAAERGRLSR